MAEKKTAGRAAVRCAALNMNGLAAAENHGKRLDRSSERRRVRDADPLVYRSLDLRAAYDAHMEGVRQNAGVQKPVLHFIVRFPPDLLNGDDVPHRFTSPSREMRQHEMLRQAVEFINRTHGGDAVFAARVDRDEEGETVIDVFAAPRYEKRTKRTKPDEKGQTWASPTKFGRDLAMKHQDEIRRRHPEARDGPLTGPRQVGIALQSEFAQFFEKVNGMPLTAKREKANRAVDRLEIDAFKEISAGREALAVDVADLDRERARVAERAAEVEQERQRLVGMRGLIEAALRDAEKALKAVLQFGPRVRRMIRSADVSEAERRAAKEARHDIVEAVPALRRDLSQTRNIMTMLRNEVSAPEEPGEEADRGASHDIAGP